jgi:nucleotide-binding universal stress UspA family protein
MPFTKILFPVDFSERSHAIVPHVRAALARFEASLTLLHLVEVPAMAYGGLDSPVTLDYSMAEMKESAEQQLAAFANDEFPGEQVKCVVEQGDPGSCIAELARHWNMDLIMLPTRGGGRVRAALRGSVAAKVLHDASCAVWTEAHCKETGAQHAEWRRILCAVDTVPEGVRLIHVAADLAKATGATVQLIHAVPGADAGSGELGDRKFADFLKESAREAIASMQEEAGTAFQVCVEGGHIPETVRLAAADYRADLVLTGRGALPHFAGRLRSHSYAIVRDMPCPVLSV